MVNLIGLEVKVNLLWDNVRRDQVDKGMFVVARTCRKYSSLFSIFYI